MKARRQPRSHETDPSLEPVRHGGHRCEPGTMHDAGLLRIDAHELGAAGWNTRYQALSRVTV